MFLSFEEVQKLISTIKLTDYHLAFVEAWKQLEIQDSVPMFQEGLLAIKLERNNLFTDSAVAPINPNLPKFETILLVTLGSRNIGRFIVTENDLNVESAEAFNFTISESVSMYLEDDYFGYWFRKNLGPLLSREVPYNQSLEMVKAQLEHFGIEVSHLFDGQHLNITVFEVEPFKVIWTITHQTTLPKNLAFYPQGFMAQMAHEVFKHLFFGVGQGMGTSYEIPELS